METLSDKIYTKGYFVGCIHNIDVKEFIKKLKEVGRDRLDRDEDFELFCEDIDKLAGDKLI